MSQHGKLIAGSVIVVAILVIGYAKFSSLEFNIISAIDESCIGEGQSNIDMTEIANFEWDTVSIFVAGNSAQIKEMLGVDPDISNGIVFSKDGQPIRVLISVYDFIHDTPPLLSYYLLENPQETGLYYKSYPYENAILNTKKYRDSEGTYKYIIYG